MTPILGITASSITSSTLGSYDSIQSTIVGSGGTGTITFSSIPSTYKHLQIRGIWRTNRGTTVDLGSMRFNNDTGSNYGYHFLVGDGGGVAADAVINLSSIYLFRPTGNTATANVFTPFIIDILDYSNTNKFTTIRVLAGEETNSVGSVWLTSGLWRNTDAITSLTISPLTGPDWMQYSSFALYGIK